MLQIIFENWHSLIDQEVKIIIKLFVCTAIYTKYSKYSLIEQPLYYVHNPILWHYSYTHHRVTIVMCGIYQCIEMICDCCIREFIYTSRNFRIVKVTHDYCCYVTKLCFINLIYLACISLLIY